MDDLLKNRELVSALADGQLRGAELARVVQLAATDADAQAAWHAYHLAGDVLRSSELASAARDDAFMSRLQASLSQVSIDAPETAAVLAVPVTVAAGKVAANESNFRWKLLAGFASVAAVGAIGWSTVSVIGADATQSQLAKAGAVQPAVVAAAPAVPQAPATPEGQTQQQVTVAGSPQVMLRDPRLDELLSAHRQFGGTSALQMPAGFLRNATFESPGR